MIDYLVKRAVGAPIFVLGVGRLELLDERQWSQHDSLKLRPLPSAACKALIDNLAEVQPELRSQIVRGAGGNPLFVEQLLAYASAEGELNTIPPSLEALLASRLDLLEQRDLAGPPKGGCYWSRVLVRSGRPPQSRGRGRGSRGLLARARSKGFVRAGGAGKAFGFTTSSSAMRHTTRSEDAAFSSCTSAPPNGWISKARDRTNSSATTWSRRTAVEWTSTPRGQSTRRARR